MDILIIQHVAFEKPGHFINIFNSYNPNIHYLNIYEDSPDRGQNYDVLLIMGGPMNIYEENVYPWLKEEKKIISEAITEGKIVIGVCLGAQLIADSLGAKIYKNKSPEIGWFPVKKTNDRILNFLPDFATVFHWHGETFNIPEKCIAFYSSDVTENQAFIYDRRVLGLQFHLEMQKEDINALIENCRDEIKDSVYVMQEQEMLDYFNSYSYNNKRMLENLILWLFEENFE